MTPRSRPPGPPPRSGPRPRSRRATTIAALATALALVPGLVAVAAPAGEAAPPISGTAAAPVATTDTGAVRGRTAEGVREFLGVPYAAPPVGSLRWNSPRPAAPWQGVRDATRATEGCPQQELPPYEPAAAEDCLHLNVTTPAKDGDRRPVILWLHPSGFSAGQGVDTAAREFSRRGDVVVVTANYRLGVLGFLSHPALDGSANKSGNFGLEDQQEAMRWVRRNAAAFGGDPRNVTLAGQWSGGRSVCAQLAAPAARGLFDKAISMSMPCTIDIVPTNDGAPDPVPPGLPRPRSVALGMGQELAATVGCADPATAAACLRKKPAMDLVKAGDEQGSLLWTPAFGDNPVLPQDPIVALQRGQVAPVPVLHGTNRDAYRTSDAILEAFGFPPLTAEQYEVRVRGLAGERFADRALALYPLKNYGTPSEAWGALATDALITRPMLETHRLLGRNAPAYAYEFADPDTPWYSNEPEPSFPTGSFQDGELQYIFETTYFGRTLTPAQKRLSWTMMHLWARFARTGDPGRMDWPAAAEDPHAALTLAPGNGGIRVTDVARTHRFAFWRTVLP